MRVLIRHVRWRRSSGRARLAEHTPRGMMIDHAPREMIARYASAFPEESVPGRSCACVPRLTIDKKLHPCYTDWTAGYDFLSGSVLSSTGEMQSVLIAYVHYGDADFSVHRSDELHGFR